MNSNIKEFENLSVEKKTLSTALGFEPRSVDCEGCSNSLNIIAIICNVQNVQEYITVR